MSRLRDGVDEVGRVWRQLARRPAYALLGIGTLALGLGATVALASVVGSLLVKPLPVRDEARLAVFWSDYDWRGVEFDFVKERQQAFSGLAAYSTEGYALRIGDVSSVIVAGVASAELFDVLDVRPLFGRTFVAGEDRPGAAPVMVVSHGLWQQELGGDPNVVGRQVEVDGQQVTVIGVMPRGFYFPTPQHRAWRPLTLDATTESYHGNGWLVLVGRVRDEVSRGVLDADVQAIARALGERFRYPQAWDKSKGATLRTLRDYTVGDVRPAVLLLLGAVALVLLVACANVAALVLARTTDRTAELALRAALGAGRGRLVAQIVIESLTLSVLAGAVGAVVAASGFRALVASLPLRDGLDEVLAMDWTLLAAALGLSLVVGLLVAAAPLRALLTGPTLTVSRERSRPGGGARRAHGVLVAAEVALAVLLVAGATMLVRSVSRLYAIDAGFEAHGVTAVDLVTPSTSMPPGERLPFFREVLDRVSGLPGVRAAGLVTRLPIRDGGWQGTITVEGRPDLTGGREPNAYIRVVTPGYFQTMGIALQQGRLFTPQDRDGAEAVCLVSESFARLMWPGEDPLGRRIRSSLTGRAEWRSVVGVVEEARLVGMTGENPIVFYVPLEQTASVPEGQVLVMRSGGGEVSVPAVRQLVRDIDSRVALARVTSLEDVVASALAEPLRLRFFLTLLATLALVLGAVGIYGVVSYSVVRRRSEFGVRLALGAAPARILTDVVRAGLTPVAVGIVVGVGALLALARVVARFLFDVSPFDPISLGAAVTALLTAGVVAAAIPGWRAGRIDPVEALRAE